MNPEEKQKLVNYHNAARCLGAPDAEAQTSQIKFNVYVTSDAMKQRLDLVGQPVTVDDQSIDNIKWT